MLRAGSFSYIKYLVLTENKSPVKLPDDSQLVLSWCSRQLTVFEWTNLGLASAYWQNWCLSLQRGSDNWIHGSELLLYRTTNLSPWGWTSILDLWGLVWFWKEHGNDTFDGVTRSLSTFLSIMRRYLHTGYLNAGQVRELIWNYPFYFLPWIYSFLSHPFF